MDPFIRLMIMMRQFATRRISRLQFWFLIVLLCFCFSLALYEHLFGWPSFLTVNPPGVHRMPVMR